MKPIECSKPGLRLCVCCVFLQGQWGVRHRRDSPALECTTTVLLLWCPRVQAPTPTALLQQQTPPTARTPALTTVSTTRRTHRYGRTLEWRWSCCCCWVNDGGIQTKWVEGRVRQGQREREITRRGWKWVGDGLGNLDKEDRKWFDSVSSITVGLHQTLSPHSPPTSPLSAFSLPNSF